MTKVRRSTLTRRGELPALCACVCHVSATSRHLRPPRSTLAQRRCRPSPWPPHRIAFYPAALMSFGAFLNEVGGALARGRRSIYDAPFPASLSSLALPVSTYFLYFSITSLSLPRFSLTVPSSLQQNRKCPQSPSLVCALHMAGARHAHKLTSAHSRDSNNLASPISVPRAPGSTTPRPFAVAAPWSYQQDRGWQIPWTAGAALTHLIFSRTFQGNSGLQVDMASSLQ